MLCGDWQVLQEAGIDPSEVAYVEAHGTGTVVGERTVPIAVTCARTAGIKNMQVHPDPVEDCSPICVGAAGDAQELSSIDAVYGAGDARRTASNPLLIGSVKSNMGHCEGGSGLAGDGSQRHRYLLLFVTMLFHCMTVVNRLSLTNRPDTHMDAALSKVLLAYENGVIPANLHYHEPNPNCDSLKNGVVKVKLL
jgi:fatty acid synthase